MKTNILEQLSFREVPSFPLQTAVPFCTSPQNTAEHRIIPQIQVVQYLEQQPRCHRCALSLQDGLGFADGSLPPSGSLLQTHSGRALLCHRERHMAVFGFMVHQHHYACPRSTKQPS